MNQSTLYKPSDLFAVARDEAEVDDLTNNDIYKFLMLDFALANPQYHWYNVKWNMTIRSKDVRTAEVIPYEALNEQLKATQSIQGISEAKITYFQWMTKKDGSPQFRKETLEFLRTFRLPDYKIDVIDGNYNIEFMGSTETATMREIFWLKIINYMYLYHYIKKEKLSRSEFNSIINETIHRLYQDIKIFKTAPGVIFSEFWTRRAASTDIQRMVFQILSEMIPNQCIGTSNVMLSSEAWNNNPKWTNAHQLRMEQTALYDNPEDIIKAMYDVDRDRGKHFPGLGILLPDTYGTTFYLNNCPEDIAMGHDGNRFDSKDPMISIPEYMKFLEKYGLDPRDKMGIPSDGLDAQKDVDIYNAFGKKIKLSFGNGTHLTNNTKGTWPRDTEARGPFWSFSAVIKPSAVQRPDGTRVPAVKLSDNFAKATEGKVPGYIAPWGWSRLEFFKKIFGTEWMTTTQTVV